MQSLPGIINEVSGESTGLSQLDMASGLKSALKIGASNASKGLNVTDAMKILYGKSNSATEYLQRTTSSQLTRAFKPVISSSLNKVDATRYWTDIMSTYNQIPFVKKMNPDLANYVTKKALAGMFRVVGEEEQQIRKDPAARVTSIVKKVFGYKDAHPK